MYIKKQKGAALIVALVCLILVSMMGVLSMKTATTSAKISANSKHSSQALRMAESALTSFFIDPTALWDLETVQVPPEQLTPALIGNAQVPVQAQFTHIDECKITIGIQIEGSGTESSRCLFFKATAHYEVNSLTSATASSGFNDSLDAAN